jgi:hypothetical protein
MTEEAVWPSSRIFGEREPFDQVSEKVRSKGGAPESLRPGYYHRRGPQGRYLQRCWVIVDETGKVTSSVRLDRIGRVRIHSAPECLYSVAGENGTPL